MHVFCIRVGVTQGPVETEVIGLRDRAGNQQRLGVFFRIGQHEGCLTNAAVGRVFATIDCGCASLLEITADPDSAILSNGVQNVAREDILAAEPRRVSIVCTAESKFQLRWNFEVRIKVVDLEVRAFASCDSVDHVLWHTVARSRRHAVFTKTVVNVEERCHAIFKTECTTVRTELQHVVC